MHGVQTGLKPDQIKAESIDLQVSEGRLYPTHTAPAKTQRFYGFV